MLRINRHTIIDPEWAETSKLIDEIIESSYSLKDIANKSLKIANQIAKSSKRGPSNYIVTSSKTYEQIYRK